MLAIDVRCPVCEAQAGQACAYGKGKTGTHTARIKRAVAHERGPLLRDTVYFDHHTERVRRVTEEGAVYCEASFASSGQHHFQAWELEYDPIRGSWVPTDGQAPHTVGPPAQPVTVKRLDIFGDLHDTHATEAELNGWRPGQGRLL